MATKTTRKAVRKPKARKSKPVPIKAVEIHEPVPEPEKEKVENQAAASRFGSLGRMMRRIKRGRKSIEKRIEKTALKLGLNPQKLVSGVWEVLLLLPRFAMLTLRLLADSRVPLRLRILCGLTLLYLLSPLDLIPEMIIGPAGLLDDLALLLMTLNILINEADPEIVREHWKGDEDVLRIISESVSLVEWFMPKGVGQAVRNYFVKKKE